MLFDQIDLDEDGGLCPCEAMRMRPDRYIVRDGADDDAGAESLDSAFVRRSFILPGESLLENGGGLKHVLTKPKEKTPFSGGRAAVMK